MGGGKSITAAGPIGRYLLWAAAQRIQPAEGNGTAHTEPGQNISTQPLKIPSKCSPGLRESWHFSCTQVQIFKSLPYNWTASFPTPGLTVDDEMLHMLSFSAFSTHFNYSHPQNWSMRMSFKIIYLSVLPCEVQTAVVNISDADIPCYQTGFFQNESVFWDKLLHGAAQLRQNCSDTGTWATTLFILSLTCF